MHTLIELCDPKCIIWHKILLYKHCKATAIKIGKANEVHWNVNTHIMATKRDRNLEH